MHASGASTNASSPPTANPTGRREAEPRTVIDALSRDVPKPLTDQSPPAAPDVGYQSSSSLRRPIADVLGYVERPGHQQRGPEAINGASTACAGPPSASATWVRLPTSTTPRDTIVRRLAHVPVG